MPNAKSGCVTKGCRVVLVDRVVLELLVDLVDRVVDETKGGHVTRRLANFNGSSNFFGLQKVVRMIRMCGRYERLRVSAALQHVHGPGIRPTTPRDRPMPRIDPTLLLLNPCESSTQQAVTKIADCAAQLLLANSINNAMQLLADNVVDLIVLNLGLLESGQPVDDVINRFHCVHVGRDVPVLFMSNAQRSGVRLKKHSWGVAYHVCQRIEPAVLVDLIECSLLLRIDRGNFWGDCDASSTPQPDQQRVPEPKGLLLPEVILPPHGDSSFSLTLPLG